MIQTGGRSSGFDYLRLVLALLVMAAHSVTTSYGKEFDYGFWSTPARPLLCLLLPMFFTLSGFLVAWSLERSNNLVKFLGNRVIRIYPALAVEILLSAFILGPWLTTVPLSDYFTDKLFFIYFLNVLGDPHFYLPGVFEHNPYDALVNAQLWTVPFELLCYIALTVLTFMGIRRNKLISLLAPVVLTVAFVGYRIYLHGFENLPGHKGSVPGTFLVISFLWGVAAYKYRASLPWSRTWFLASTAIAIYCYSGSVLEGSLLDYIAPICAAYSTVYLGLTNPHRRGLMKSADFSYGIFLYHFAIQQAAMQLFPWARHWYWNLLICTPVVVVFAAASWNLVEKPALRLKKYLDATDKWQLSSHLMDGWREGFSYLLRKSRQG